jgi:hypothetical protein
LHLASRLNPVNGLWGIETPVRANRSGRGQRLPTPKAGTNVRARGNLLRIFAPALALLQHSPAIEGEKHFQGADRL